MLVVVACCCCWLLLLTAAGCCSWLLLLIASVGCCWLLLAARILLAGRRNFEFFRDIGSLRLRQFCRRKGLWLFSGCWWKVFEYFRVVVEKSLNISRILMRWRWKSVSPRGRRVVGCSKRMNHMALHWVLILVWSHVGGEPIGSFGEKPRASRLVL